MSCCGGVGGLTDAQRQILVWLDEDGGQSTFEGRRMQAADALVRRGFAERLMGWGRGKSYVITDAGREVLDRG